jgi:hypothetical protein
MKKILLSDGIKMFNNVCKDNSVLSGYCISNNKFNSKIFLENFKDININDGILGHKIIMCKLYKYSDYTFILTNSRTNKNILCSNIFDSNLDKAKIAENKVSGFFNEVYMIDDRMYLSEMLNKRELQLKFHQKFSIHNMDKGSFRCHLENNTCDTIKPFLKNQDLPNNININYFNNEMIDIFNYLDYIKPDQILSYLEKIV